MKLSSIFIFLFLLVSTPFVYSASGFGYDNIDSRTEIITINSSITEDTNASTACVNRQALLGNGSCQVPIFSVVAGSGDITAVNPFDESIIINNSASGDVYVQANETRINNSASALDNVINETQRAWAVANFIDIANESVLNVNSSNFLNTAQGTITNVNSSEFNVTAGTLTIYLDWLTDFIGDIATGITVAVENIRSGDTYNIFNSSTGIVQLDFNETRLNRTINAFVGNGTFTGFLRDDGDTATGNYTFDTTTFFIDSSSNRIGIGTVSPSHDLDIHGHMEIEHTADETNDHGIEIHLDAAGFGGSKAIFVNYITGAIGEGEDEEAFLINIDQSLATGGEVIGLEILATEGSANIFGMQLGALISPIVQLSGVFGNMTSASVAGTDRLTEFTHAASDIPMFVNDDDNITIGHTVRFQQIEFLLATTSSGPGIAPTFEFSTGVGTWTTFTPTDGTSGMRANGVVLWLNDDIPTWAVGSDSEFKIRITRTRNTLTTVPIEDLVLIAVTDEFMWDREGNVTIANLTADTINASRDICITGGNCLSSAGGSGDITAVNPFDISIIINNSQSGDVYVQVNESRINDTINAFLGNGTFTGGSGDITAVNPFDSTIIINNSASGDVYVQGNETRSNRSATALDLVINETQRAWADANFIDIANEGILNVNSSEFLDTAQGTIDNVNSTEFNVTVGTLTIYTQWLSDFISDIATGLTVAVENIRSGDTYNIFNSSTGVVQLDFNETRLNRTATALDIASNTTMGAYVVAKNNTLATYIVSLNTSQITWADGKFIPLTSEANLNVNSSNFFNPISETTINDVNTTEFNVTVGTFTIYKSWLSDFISDIASGLTVAVESIRSGDTYNIFNASTADVQLDFNETRLNRTITALDIASNTTMGTYVRAQDVIFNTTMGTYVVAKNNTLATYIVSLNTSQVTWADGKFLLNTGDTATGNYTFDTTTFFIDSTNNNVGFNTTTPRGSAVTIKGDLNMTAKTGESGIIFHNGTGICIGACA